MNLDKNFDKLLLTAILIVFMVMWIIVLKSPYSTNWIENVAGQVLAALLTLMVGARAAVRTSDNGNGNGNGNGVAKPSDTGGEAAKPIGAIFNAGTTTK